jgi:hypothetical protein
MFGRKDSEFLLGQLSLLHPVNLDGEAEAVKAALSRHGAEIDTLLAELDPEKYADVSVNYIVRLLLVCQVSAVP